MLGRHLGHTCINQAMPMALSIPADTRTDICTCSSFEQHPAGMAESTVQDYGADGRHAPLCKGTGWGEPGLMCSVMCTGGRVSMDPSISALSYKDHYRPASVPVFFSRRYAVLIAAGWIRIYSELVIVVLLFILWVVFDARSAAWLRATLELCRQLTAIGVVAP